MDKTKVSVSRIGTRFGAARFGQSRFCELEKILLDLSNPDVLDLCLNEDERKEIEQYLLIVAFRYKDIVRINELMNLPYFDANFLLAAWDKNPFADDGRYLQVLEKVKKMEEEAANLKAAIKKRDEGYKKRPDQTDKDIFLTYLKSLPQDQFNKIRGASDLKLLAKAAGIEHSYASETLKDNWFKKAFPDYLLKSGRPLKVKK